MNKFIIWVIASISSALLGLIVVLNMEDWARLSGDVERSILLTGTLSTFLLVIVSLFCLVKANTDRKKTKLLISLFTSLVPLSVFVMNSLIFTVWFIRK